MSKDVPGWLNGCEEFPSVILSEAGGSGVSEEPQDAQKHDSKTSFS
jgi:hypothetical protein